MNLDKYIELTGETVTSSNENKVKATIRRTKAQLETLLGYSLKPTNLYTEKGKVQYESLLSLPTNDKENLTAPDEEEVGYKLFPFHEADRYFHVDPYKNLYHVKLVKPINDSEFITVIDLENFSAKVERNGHSRFIQKYHDWFTWHWYLSYAQQLGPDNGLMLAIDAEWIDCYKDDLNYLWADMISYYSNDDYSVNGNIKSESVDGHSWSKNPAGGGSQDLAPEDTVSGQRVLARYLGPFGSLARNPVR